MTNSSYFEKIDIGIKLTKYKKNNEPNNPMYPYIEELLLSMRAIVSENIQIVEEGNVGNELGMLVVRRIDDKDPDYADILIEISDNFENDFVVNNN